MNPYLKKLKEIQAKMGDMLKKATDEDRIFTEEEKTSYENLKTEFANIKEMADAWQASQDATNALNEPEDDDNTPHIHVKPDGHTGPFKNMTQQLASVRNAAFGNGIDERLKVVNAILGSSESSVAELGHAVQSDFAGMLLDTAVKDDPLLSLIDTYQVSAGSNSVRWVELNEKGSVETYVFGGVRVYWAAEGASITATNPNLIDKELKLEKLVGLAYCTYELSDDSNFIDQLYSRAFQLAIRRELGGCVIAGNGVGKPLGVGSCPALVEVPKETGQAADTIVLENVSKMYHRAIDKTRGVWVMHPDCHEQLDFLEFPVGTGGIPIYLPGTSQGSIDMLRGRRIIESDHCAALGDKNDILFMDPQQYVIIYKGGVQKDVSIHVQFLTAQNAFRFIFRANGMPKVSQKMRIKNSSRDRSPYITLAARA